MLVFCVGRQQEKSNCNKRVKFVIRKILAKEKLQISFCVCFKKTVVLLVDIITRNHHKCVFVISEEGLVSHAILWLFVQELYCPCCTDDCTVCVHVIVCGKILISILIRIFHAQSFHRPGRCGSHRLDVRFTVSGE